MIVKSREHSPAINAKKQIHKQLDLSLFTTNVGYDVWIFFFFLKEQKKAQESCSRYFSKITFF